MNGLVCLTRWLGGTVADWLPCSSVWKFFTFFSRVMTLRSHSRGSCIGHVHIPIITFMRVIDYYCPVKSQWSCLVLWDSFIFIFTFCLKMRRLRKLWACAFQDVGRAVPSTVNRCSKFCSHRWKDVWEHSQIHPSYGGNRSGRRAGSLGWKYSQYVYSESRDRMEKYSANTCKWDHCILKMWVGWEYSIKQSPFFICFF